MEAVGECLPKRMRWAKGECTVEILSRGHYPSTVRVKLPNEVVTEVELTELETE